jgi:hypothetical protein
MQRFLVQQVSGTYWFSFLIYCMPPRYLNFIEFAATGVCGGYVLFAIGIAWLIARLLVQLLAGKKC